MKIAYLHALPLEYYPPARNALVLMSQKPGWKVRTWTSRNRRGLGPWSQTGVEISRPRDAAATVTWPLRLIGNLAWHSRAAAQIAAWRPDVLISVEPHSALAAWMYYHVFRGNATLFIHHHEYYSPEDFTRPGMRVLRATRRLEREDLFSRASWVSQTNAARLRMLRDWSPRIRKGAEHVLPNYPPEAWIGRASSRVRESTPKIRAVYIGSASFEDTFIREAATWIARNPDRISLHVAGENIQPDVKDWLDDLGVPNVTVNARAYDYDQLPSMLAQFDVGLVLYKGNTLNFVHNVPNKAVEYLACGLDVWYPPEMKGMSDFHATNPGERMLEIDFRNPEQSIPAFLESSPGRRRFPFTNEAAMAPLIADIERLAVSGHG